MDVKSKTKKYYDGTTDVEAFITITDLNAALKGYADEKKAQFFASLLVEGPALNVYLRLDDDKRKDAEEIKTALRHEFEEAHRDREVALEKLSQREMLKDESPFTYAYALLELAKLAYSSLPAASQDAIARDHFVKGQSKDMQVALKSLANFSNKPLMDLAKEAVRFQTAGVQPTTLRSTAIKMEVNEISERSSEGDTLVDTIVDKVVAKLSDMNVAGASNVSVDYVQNFDRRSRNFNPRGPRGNFYRRGNYQDRRNDNRGPPQGNRGTPNRGTFNCRSCRSPSHGYAKCPTRFCQACGNKGHDAWSRDCPNF